VREMSYQPSNFVLNTEALGSRRGGAICVNGRRSLSAARAGNQGLLQAQNACRLTPDNGSYLNTLGVAQYRVGDYQSALATLTRSEKLNAVFYKGPFPGDLAFLAMAHHRLGQKEQAQSMLKRLREAIGQPKWKKDEESQAFFREAETLLGLQPSLKN
jgi:tetratricopeptide (TPR) repeat protein